MADGLSQVTPFDNPSATYYEDNSRLCYLSSTNPLDQYRGSAPDSSAIGASLASDLSKYAPYHDAVSREYHKNLDEQKFSDKFHMIQQQQLMIQEKQEQLNRLREERRLSLLQSNAGSPHSDAELRKIFNPDMNKDDINHLESFNNQQNQRCRFDDSPYGNDDDNYPQPPIDSLRPQHKTFPRKRDMYSSIPNDKSSEIKISSNITSIAGQNESIV